MLVPRATTGAPGGPLVRDEALLAWVRTVVDTVIDPGGAEPVTRSGQSQGHLQGGATA